MKEKESVEIVIRDLETNPSCSHGPTILFSSKNGKYFSCSCDRTKNCFYLKFEDFNKHKEEILAASNEEDKTSERRTDLEKISEGKRFFCMTCNEFVLFEPKYHKSHNLKTITDQMVKEPSLFLPQLDNDKLNAQYFFDDTTLNFINSVFDELMLSKIVCMGAPRLHDFLKNLNKESILLDIDKRYSYFPHEFIHYNMFNNYFFDKQNDEKKFINFLTANNHDERSRHCLFLDPPFAGRTELISQTIKTISYAYFKLTRKLLPIFWVFPYFNEHHIKKFMPEMEMMDFQVTYINHDAFKADYKGRKEGSVVRIFTNVPLNLIKYPENLENYRHCKSCDKYVAKTNIHCKFCKNCPSKNGSTYKHCKICSKCVKSNYIHCRNCGRCTQKFNHDCKIFQSHQECLNCHEKGHVEKYCKKNKMKKTI